MVQFKDNHESGHGPQHAPSTIPRHDTTTATGGVADADRSVRAGSQVMLAASELGPYIPGLGQAYHTSVLIDNEELLGE